MCLSVIHLLDLYILDRWRRGIKDGIKIPIYNTNHKGINAQRFCELSDLCDNVIDLGLSCNTPFEKAKPISSEYYAEWIKKTRIAFPKITIIAGSWLTHLNEISLLLKAGADGITKFPGIKKFGSIYAKQIEQEVKEANMIFASNLTNKPNIKLPDNKIIKEKINLYLKQSQLS